jgi:MFS transporter, FSR family, fosmidomycin resistance protein
MIGPEGDVNTGLRLAIARSPVGQERRSRQTLAVACLVHALHDGYTDLIYILLPIWQAEFGLDYAALASLRGLYAGAMASLQIPAGRLAEALSSTRVVLAVGTLLSGIGYAITGYSGGATGLMLGLALGGAGSSTQHPLASAAVARAYGDGARGPLGIYNFAGDVGKASLPALTSLLLTIMPWRHASWLLCAVGIIVAAIVAVGLPAMAAARTQASKIVTARGSSGRGAYFVLLAIGVLDSAVRMGFLTFLPFLLQAKGADLPTVGLALTLVFVGGAAGKFACGWLGARVGILWTVLATEAGTAAAILGVLGLSLLPALVILPLLGIMLNGTSSVLYGTVPELAPAGRTERAFALFYTGSIGSGAVAPVLYGWLGDSVGLAWATAATAASALMTVPLAISLAARLRSQ